MAEKQIKDSWIDTYEIKPPVGENAFGAKAVVAYSSEDQKKLSEHWGKTKKKAEEKAQAELDEYLKANK